MVQEYGCHLVIGGSPCNNITGNNRQSSTTASGRSGFGGEDSKLFIEFVRALNLVREAYGAQ